MEKIVHVRPKNFGILKESDEKLGLAMMFFFMDPKKQKNKTNYIGNVSKMGLGGEKICIDPFY